MATTKEKLGQVFRLLRKQKDWSQARMAEELASVGCRVKTAPGVSRLEKRGTTRHEYHAAYATICNLGVEEIDRLASRL